MLKSTDMVHLNLSTEGASKVNADLLKIKNALSDLKVAAANINHQIEVQQKIVSGVKREIASYNKDIKEQEAIAQKSADAAAKWQAKIEDLEAAGKSGSSEWQLYNDKMNASLSTMEDATAKAEELRKSRSEANESLKLEKEALDDLKTELQKNTDAQAENKQELIDATKQLKITDMSYNQLRQRAAMLRKELDDTSKSLEPERWKALNKELEETEEQMDKVSAGGKEVKSRFEDLKGTFQTSFAVLAGNLMTKAIDGIKELVSAGIDWVKSGIDMAKSAEGVVTAFDKLNNSKRHLADMRNATKETISDLKLMEKTVRANEMGIGIENMATLLQFAQVQAKKMKTDVDYMADSIVDGLGRKSTMILDNLGISAGQVQAEFKKTGDFTAAVLNIVNQRLREQGDEALTGAEKAAQASAKWENAQLKVGQKFQWLGETWDKVKSKMADNIDELIGDTRSLSEQYQGQIEKVSDLEVNVAKLLPRYDELKKKTSLSKDEQKELNTIMQKISEILPVAVTEWDRYGNAISINTQKVRDFIATEKIRLKLMYEDKIKERRADLVGYVSEFERLQKQIDKLNKGETLYKSETIFQGSNTGATTSYLKELSDDEITDLRKRYAEVKGLVLDTNKEIDYMTGTSAEKQLLTQNKMEENRNAFNAMTKNQLDAWIKDEKNAANEYMNIAKQVYNQKFATNTTGSSSNNKQTDENKKALEKQLKDLDDYIILEKNKLAQQRLDNTLSHDQYLKEQERLELEALGRRFDIYNLEPDKQQQIFNQILEYKIQFHEAMLEEEKLFNENMEQTQSDALSRGIAGLDQFSEAWKKQQEDAFEAANEAEQEAERKRQAYANIAKSFAEQSGDILTAHMQDAESSTAEFQYNMLMLALDTLRQVVLLATVEAIAKEIGSKGIVGIATGAAAALAINLAFAAIKGSIKKPSTGKSSDNDQSTTTHTRVVTPGLEEGGYIDVERSQDGKPFTAIYDPDKRGFVDKPTVLVGEGPAGKSMEWVAGNEAYSNPTIRPIIDLIDAEQRAGTVATVDMNRLIRARMAGLDTGGFIAAPTSQQGQGRSGSPSGGQGAIPDNRDILLQIYDFIKNNRLKAEINYQDLKDTEQKMTDYESFGSKY